ncbi:MAG: hypothetical protein M1835_008143 [Candelina submexicana]|nr:MAG: hypothetical protein M1835_008143 [Candelina submexicana]
MGSSPESKQPFPFLKLPPELRNRVYEYAFLTERAIHIFEYVRPTSDTKTLEGGFKALTLKRNGGLLRTNRQINYEALPIRYCNSFSFTFPCYLLRFLQRIGPFARAKIRGVQVGWHSTDSAAEAFNLLGTCESLERLIVDINVYWLMESGQTQLTKLRDTVGMNELRQIRGIKELTIQDTWCLKFHELGCQRCFRDEDREWIKQEVTKPRP